MDEPRATRQAGNFPRGAKATPPNVLRAKPKFSVRAGQAPPAEFATVPEKLDYWGNDQYGCCVSTEEAFAKACHNPEIFIEEANVIEWASHHGVLNGATLDEVLTAMLDDGFQVGPQRYNDGRAVTVDYTKPDTLKAAIAEGPVKIAIDADALPQGAGRSNGWFALGSGRYSNTDHCVALAGYGSAAFLYGKMGIPVPSGLPATTQGYLLFTWSTLGFVDHKWLLNTCVEAWLRQPTTVGVPPLDPGPGPGPEPTPDKLQAAIPPLDVLLLGWIPIGSTRPAIAPVGPAVQLAGMPGMPTWVLMLLRMLCASAPMILQEPLRSLVMQLCAQLPQGEASHRCQEVAPAKPLAPTPLPKKEIPKKG